MSSKGQDAFLDWYQDHEYEILEGYLEDKGWNNFQNWLWAKPQESTYNALKELFLSTDSPERKKFEEYAQDHFESIGPDDADNGLDR